MPAFVNGTNRKMLTDKSNNLRFIIMDYLREETKQGHVVDAEIEGRITVEQGGEFYEKDIIPFPFCRA